MTEENGNITANEKKLAKLVLELRRQVTELEEEKSELTEVVESRQGIIDALVKFFTAVKNAHKGVLTKKKEQGGEITNPLAFAEFYSEVLCALREFENA